MINPEDIEEKAKKLPMMQKLKIQKAFKKKLKECQKRSLIDIDYLLNLANTLIDTNHEILEYNRIKSKSGLLQLKSETINIDQEIDLNIKHRKKLDNLIKVYELPEEIRNI